MSYEQLIDAINQLFTNTKAYLVMILPKLLGALVVLLIGVLIAKLFQMIIRRVIIKADRILENRKSKGRFQQLNLERSAGVISRIVYWIIIIFFATAATEIVGLPIVTTWLSSLVVYLPNILVAVVIVFLGFTGGNLLKEFIIITSEKAGLAHGLMLGKSIQYILIGLTVLIAFNQIGINIGILTQIIDIIIAAILFGAALAFGLGARTSISNILASYYLQNRYREGNDVKIGGVEGKIIQITPIAVIIETKDGQVSVPAKDFSENVSTLLSRENVN